MTTRSEREEMIEELVAIGGPIVTETAPQLTDAQLRAHLDSIDEETRRRDRIHKRG